MQRLITFLGKTFQKKVKLFIAFTSFLKLLAKTFFYILSACWGILQVLEHIFWILFIVEETCRVNYTRVIVLFLDSYFSEEEKTEKLI